MTEALLAVLGGTGETLLHPAYKLDKYDFYYLLLEYFGLGFFLAWSPYIGWGRLGIGFALVILGVLFPQRRAEGFPSVPITILRLIIAVAGVGVILFETVSTAGRKIDHKEAMERSVRETNLLKAIEQAEPGDEVLAVDYYSKWEELETYHVANINQAKNGVHIKRIFAYRNLWEIFRYYPIKDYIREQAKNGVDISFTVHPANATCREGFALFNSRKRGESVAYIEQELFENEVHDVLNIVVTQAPSDLEMYRRCFTDLLHISVPLVAWQEEMRRLFHKSSEPTWLRERFEYLERHVSIGDLNRRLLRDAATLYEYMGRKKLYKPEQEKNCKGCNYEP